MKNLPQSRESSPEAFLEYETKVTPPGRLKMQDMMMLLSQHQYDPVKFSLETLSTDHKLDISDTAKLTKYYAVFMVHPKPSVKESMPSIAPTHDKDQKQLEKD